MVDHTVSRQLRVLHVTNMYPTQMSPASGAFVSEQVRALGDLGIKQEVMVIPSGGSSTKYLKAVREVRKRVLENPFHLVHAHYGLVGWVTAFQPRPLVVTFAGSDLNGVQWGRLGQRLRGRLEVLASQWAASRAHRVIVVSERLRQRLWSVRVRNESVVLPYGIDTSRFTPGDRSAARKRFGLGQDERIVLWPHSLSPIKRRDLADVAMEIARRSLPTIRLWQPPRMPNYEMPHCYQAADCLLMTSQSEGSPGVVKEALSAALPVVSVDVGDVWDLLRELPWCSRVGRSPLEIAAGVVRCLEMPRPEAAPALVRAFDVQMIANQLRKIYMALTQASGGLA